MKFALGIVDTRARGLGAYVDIGYVELAHPFQYITLVLVFYSHLLRCVIVIHISLEFLCDVNVSR